MSKIDPTKPCIGLYSFSTHKGHTTAEVFIQQTAAGDIVICNERGGASVQFYIRVGKVEVKEFQAIARFQEGGR